MTITQSIHHEEQVAAARRDFNAWWDNEILCGSYCHMTRVQKIQHQVTAWRAWLKAKGLDHVR